MKKILVPMLEAGAGHKMPALAVKDAIERLFPGQYQVDVIDFARECGALKSDRSMKKAWDMGLANPFFARLGYRLANGLWPLSMFWFRHMYPDFMKKAIKYVEQYKPDMIFSTNFATSTVSAMVKKKLKLDVEVITYVTDPFDAYGWWIDKNVDIICVASEKAKAQIVKRKYPAERVKVLPFPIHNKFFSVKEDPAHLRSRLGLKEGIPTILTSEGGQGIGKISGYVLKMYAEGVPCNIISICGKNEVLKNELEKLVASKPSATHLLPLGFVDNMNELLGISDLCIAKAGASTTFEALLKGVPIIFSSWATYSEKPNVDFCVERNIGWFTPTYDEFKKLLNKLLFQDELKHAKETLASLKMHSGSEDVARFLQERISTRK